MSDNPLRATDEQRWSAYLFELERIAAVMHVTGMTFDHYIQMAALAWNITGQSIDMTLVNVAKEGQAKQ